MLADADSEISCAVGSGVSIVPGENEQKAASAA